MQRFTDDYGIFCLVFYFSSTSCCNSNVLPQFRMTQQCSIVTESWKRSITRSD